MSVTWPAGIGPGRMNVRNRPECAADLISQRMRHMPEEII